MLLFIVKVAVRPPTMSTKLIAYNKIKTGPGVHMKVTQFRRQFYDVCWSPSATHLSIVIFLLTIVLSQFATRLAMQVILFFDENF